MKTKFLNLPSGHEVEIRQIKENDCMELSEMLVFGMTDAMPSSSQVVNFAGRVIEAGAINPAFSNCGIFDEDMDRDDVVHVLDLEYHDFQFLVFEILDFSGLTEKFPAATRRLNDN